MISGQLNGKTFGLVFIQSFEVQPTDLLLRATVVSTIFGASGSLEVITGSAYLNTKTGSLASSVPELVVKLVQL